MFALLARGRGEAKQIFVQPRYSRWDISWHISDQTRVTAVPEVLWIVSQCCLYILHNGLAVYAPAVRQAGYTRIGKYFHFCCCTPSIPYVCRPLSCSHHTLFLPPTQQDTDNKMQRSVSTATPSLNNNKRYGLVCVFRTFFFEVEYLSIAGLSGGWAPG